TTLGGLGEIEFGVGVAKRRTDRGELMQQPSLVGARLDLVLLTRKLVDHRHANLGVADSVAQLRGQIPLDLLAGKGTDSLQQGADAKLRAALGEQDPSRAHRVPRVALAHRHLVGTLIASGRDHRKLVADRPERQQSDPELALYAVCRPFCLQSPLDRIADMRRNVLEVRPALLIAGNAIAVILNRYIVLAVLPAARHRNCLRVRVDAVLDELGDRLQWVPLRERDDTDRVPVIADPELAAIGGLVLPGGPRLRSPRGAIARIGKVYGRHPHSA